MSLRCPIGPESNMLEPECELESRILLDQPVLSLVDLQVNAGLSNSLVSPSPLSHFILCSPYNLLLLPTSSSFIYPHSSALPFAMLHPLLPFHSTIFSSFQPFILIFHPPPSPYQVLKRVSLKGWRSQVINIVYPARHGQHGKFMGTYYSLSCPTVL